MEEILTSSFQPAVKKCWKTECGGRQRRGARKHGAALAQSLEGREGRYSRQWTPPTKSHRHSRSLAHKLDHTFTFFVSQHLTSVIASGHDSLATPPNPMSCNGCRVLRKGCSQDCALRACLQCIPSPHSQAHATLFLAKFFGRTDLMSFISSVPLSTRPALFRSLLYEACGRTVNPVNGAVGLLSSGNWHVCEAAVQTVLAGGVLRPLPATFDGVLRPFMHDLGDMGQESALDLSLLPESCNNIRSGIRRRQSNPTTSLLVCGESDTRSSGGCGDEKNNELLSLFV